jgi:hypothetical protein
VVTVLLLAAVLGGALLVRGLGGRGDGGPGTAQPSAAASEPATLPPGYRRFEGDGYSVGVPGGWAASPARGGVVDLREPGSSRFLRMITVDGAADALSQLRAAEKQFAANDAYQPYRKLRLDRVDYRDYDAAEWEFTFTLDGTLRHVAYRGVVADGRSYGLYLSVPEGRWVESRAVLRVATETFRPGG